MRLARFLALGPLLGLLGCGVPDVVFADSDAAIVDAMPDAAAERDADAGLGHADAADTGDATDGRAGTNCMGDAGPPDARYLCCPSGAVCSGSCNAPSCAKCGDCVWPSVCCTQGSAGSCSPPGSC